MNTLRQSLLAFLTTVFVSCSNGSILDSSQNNSGNPTTTSTYTLSTASQTSTRTKAITFSVTPTGSPDPLSISNFTLATSGSAVATLGTLIETSPKNYTVHILPQSGDGVVKLRLNYGSQSAQEQSFVLDNTTLASGAPSQNIQPLSGIIKTSNRGVVTISPSSSTTFEHPNLGTLSWSKLSGKGAVTINNSDSNNPSVEIYKTGDYQLRLTATLAPFTTTTDVSFTIDDEFEVASNNTPGTARAIQWGQYQNLYLAPGDEDWFSITIPNTQRARALLRYSHPTGTDDIRVQIRDCSGSTIGTCSAASANETAGDNITAGNYRRATLLSSSTKTYFIRVYRNAGSAGVMYSLILRNNEPQIDSRFAGEGWVLEKISGATRASSTFVEEARQLVFHPVNGRLFMTASRKSGTGTSYPSHAAPTGGSFVYSFAYDNTGALTDRKLAAELTNIWQPTDVDDELVGMGFHNNQMYLAYNYALNKNGGGYHNEFRAMIFRLTDEDGDGLYGEADTSLNAAAGNMCPWPMPAAPQELCVPIVENVPASHLHTISQIEIIGNSLYAGVGVQSFVGNGVGVCEPESPYNGALSFIEDITKVKPRTVTEYVSLYNAGDTLRLGVRNHGGFADGPGFPAAAGAVACNTASPPATSALMDDIFVRGCPFDPLIAGCPSPDGGESNADLVKRKYRIHSAGIRNPFGLSQDSVGQLWASNNYHRPGQPGDFMDGDMSDDIFDGLFRIISKGDYGYANSTWRSSSIAQNAGFYSPSNLVTSTTPINADASIKNYDPANPVGLGPSASVTGTTFYYSTVLKSSFNGKMFLTRWGNPFSLSGGVGEDQPNNHSECGGTGCSAPQTAFRSFRYGDVVLIDTTNASIQRVLFNFNSPIDVAVDSAGSLVVSDYQYYNNIDISDGGLWRLRKP